MDPYQLASQKPADLDPLCFQKRIYMGFKFIKIVFPYDKTCVKRPKIGFQD